MAFDFFLNFFFFFFGGGFVVFKICFFCNLSLWFGKINNNKI